jgi:cytochrome c oxidase assembly protein subunit 15
MTDAPTPLASRWLHRWAVLTVCATLVLLGLGSAVTNFKAGMADPVWPTSPTAMLAATPEQRGDVRWVIEHSHRLAGYVVGCCAIVLAVWLWRSERRRWLCWLGTAALAGICLQGLVGGLRVLEHVRWGLEMRIVHGCFAQVVLGMLVAVAVCTSRAWAGAVPLTGERAERLRRVAVVVPALVFLQIVLGVFLRHTYHPLAQRLHLLAAFAATAGVVWLVWTARDREPRDTALRGAAAVLACLLALQLALGVEAWMVQLGPGTLPELLPVTARRVAVRTAHVMGGSLLFGATLAAALLAWRHAVPAVSFTASPARRLEGAA